MPSDTAEAEAGAKQLAMRNPDMPLSTRDDRVTCQEAALLRTTALLTPALGDQVGGVVEEAELAEELSGQEAIAPAFAA